MENDGEGTAFVLLALSEYTDAWSTSEYPDLLYKSKNIRRSDTSEPLAFGLLICCRRKPNSPNSEIKDCELLPRYLKSAAPELISDGPIKSVDVGTCILIVPISLLIPDA